MSPRPRTFLITGADSGIGEATTRMLAAQGHRVIMVCRERARAEKVQAAMRADLPAARLELLTVDLASLSDVRGLAAQLVARGEPLDVLINNAGAYVVEEQRSEGGLERTMTVNFLGPMLLTLLLEPCLARGDHPRVVNLASNAHYRAKLELDDLFATKQRYDAFKRYAASKLAVVMGTRALAQRFAERGISVNAVHPGHVSTNIWPSEGFGWRLVRPILDLFLLAPAQGAEAVVKAATDPDIEGTTGVYFDRLEARAPHERALDDTQVSTLFQRVLTLVGPLTD